MSFRLLKCSQKEAGTFSTCMHVRGVCVAVTMVVTLMLTLYQDEIYITYLWSTWQCLALG